MCDGQLGAWDERLLDGCVRAEHAPYGQDVRGSALDSANHARRRLRTCHPTRDSGYRGPIGFLGHRTERDAKECLREDLDRLKNLLQEMGDQEALKTY
jgi:hypothetical protein